MDTGESSMGNIGFNTAAGSKILINPNLLAKGRAFFENIDDDDKDGEDFGDSTATTARLDKPNNKIRPSGFNTAGGSKITITSGTLAKGRNFFKDLDDDDKDDDNVGFGKSSSAFQTTSKMDIGGNIGFSTAAGSKIIGDSNLLAKGRAFFENIDIGDDNEDFDAFEVKKPNDDVRPSFGNVGFGGFNTAAGSKITINSDTLAKGRNFFKDSDNDGDDVVGFGESSAFRTSSTVGSVAPPIEPGISLHSDLMEKGRAFFKDLDDDRDDFGALRRSHIAKKTVAVQGNGGFNTAAASKVPISSDLMAKGRALFQDLDDSRTIDSEVKKSGSTDSKPTIHSFDTTPKLPIGSKFPLGRRRLADSSPLSSSQPSSTIKRKRMSVFSRINATNDDGTPKLQLKLFSPLASTGSKRQTSSSKYSDRNAKGNGVTPVSSKLPRSEFGSQGSTSYELDDDVLTSLDLESLSQPRKKKIKLGRMYTQRQDASERTTMKSFLAGQVPRIYDSEDYQRYGVNAPTLEVNAQTARTFVFFKEYLIDSESDGDGQYILGDGVKVTADDDGHISAEGFVTAFMNSSLVDSKLISEAWCSNHYRWIVWKEAAMETAFPHLLGGRMLTPDRVMLQLKYRYDREMEKSERSCLKRILNADDSTYRPMVLCISAILMDQEVDALIELTDGWYSLKARLDGPLSTRLVQKQLMVGQKLFISRCSLIGLENGCEALEVPASAQLVLMSNCVRRARWNATLGFQHLSKLCTFPLDSLVVGGGTTAAIEVVIQKIFPMQYMVKNATGQTSVMDEKAEARDARVFQEQYDRCLEKIVEEVEKELMAEEKLKKPTQESECPRHHGGSKLIPKTQEIRSIADVEELYRLAMKTADPDAVADRATPTQKTRLQSFFAKANEQQIFRFQDKFERAIRDKADSLPQRRVTPILRMRVVGGRHPSDAKYALAPMLTMWRPDDDTIYHVKEGAAYVITNVQVVQSSTPGDTCKFSLSTTTETRFIPAQRRNVLIKMK